MPVTQCSFARPYATFLEGSVATLAAALIYHRSQVANAHTQKDRMIGSRHYYTRLLLQRVDSCYDP